jgi:predicted aspartyl protease
LLLLLVSLGACANLHAQSEVTEIPLIKKSGLYYAEVKINGNAALLLVDTGASITLLNRKFAGLAAGVVDSEVRGVGASAQGRRVRIRLMWMLTVLLVLMF